jgi:hypothetical protein
MEGQHPVNRPAQGEDPIRQVPTEYGFKWIKAGWLLTRKNYGMAMAYMAVLVILVAILSRVPIIGDFLIPAIGSILSIGYYMAVRKWVRLEKTQFKDFFIPFQQTDLILKVIPLIIINTLLALPSSVGIGIIGEGGGSSNFSGMLTLIMMIYNLLVAICLWFSLPQILFQDRDVIQTIPLNINAFFKNIGALIILFVLTVFIALASAVLFMVPFVLVFLPMTFPMLYLNYATIFEGVDLDDLMPKLEPSTTNLRRGDEA